MHKLIDISVSIIPGIPLWPGDPQVEIEKLHDLSKGDEATVSRISMGVHTGTHVDAPLHYFAERAGIDEMPPDALVGPARVVEVHGGADKEIQKEELEKHGIKQGERILLKSTNSKLWIAQSAMGSTASRRVSKSPPPLRGRDKAEGEIIGHPLPTLPPQGGGNQQRSRSKLQVTANLNDQDRFSKEFYVHLGADAARLLAEKKIRAVGIDYLSIGGCTGDSGAQVHRILLEAGIWIIEGLDLSLAAPGSYELICLPLKLQGLEAAPARACLRPILPNGK